MYANVCTFHTFLALNPTPIISDTSNLNTTFVLMVPIIILSFIDWPGDVVGVCSVHVRMRISHNMHVRQCVHIS